MTSLDSYVHRPHRSPSFLPLTPYPKHQQAPTAGRPEPLLTSSADPPPVRPRRRILRPKSSVSLACSSGEPSRDPRSPEIHGQKHDVGGGHGWSRLQPYSTLPVKLYSRPQVFPRLHFKQAQPSVATLFRPHKTPLRLTILSDTWAHPGRTQRKSPGPA